MNLDLAEARHLAAQVSTRLFRAIDEIEKSKSLIPYDASINISAAIMDAYSLKTMLALTFPVDNIEIKKD